MDSQFWNSMLGGVVGGLTTGLVLAVLARAYGRREADRFVREQLDVAETRVKAFVTDSIFGQITALLEKSERVGQIAKRILEIVQLGMGGKLREAPAGPGVADAPVAALHATLGEALISLGRTDEARRAFEEALRLDPQHAGARAQLLALAR